MYLLVQRQKRSCNMLDKDQLDMDDHQHGSLRNDAFLSLSNTFIQSKGDSDVDDIVKLVTNKVVTK